MNTFPTVLPIVKPLYTPEAGRGRKQEQIEETGKKKTTNTVAPLATNDDGTKQINVETNRNNINDITYLGKIKITKAKMYEPVADNCVTILTRFNEKEYPPAHMSDEETKEQKNIDNNRSKMETPEKPPRRVKLHKQKNKNCPNVASEVSVISKNSCCERKDDHRVDLEDINRLSVESEKNYKNKFHSVGIQAMPLPPYRLRVWPRRGRKIKGDREKYGCGKERFRFCVATLGRWIFSQCGLAIVIIIWALLGAAAFHETEGPREREQAEELQTLQNNLAIGLATELRQVVPHEPVWLSMVQNYFAKHETLLLQAVSSGYGEGGGGGHIWTYPGCFLFAVSLLTTLGFGAPVPRTTLGRGAAVLFSAVGIPLHFLLVLNIGMMIASKIQSFALKRTEPPSSPRSFTASPPAWLKYFPFAAIACYYTLGVILFGFVRQRAFAESLLFPLDFTATGGVAKTFGHVRIFYALYLEVAVALAATSVSLLQVSASRSVINLGLRLGLLTNT